MEDHIRFGQKQRSTRQVLIDVSLPQAGSWFVRVFEEDLEYFVVREVGFAKMERDLRQKMYHFATARAVARHTGREPLVKFVDAVQNRELASTA